MKTIERFIRISGGMEALEEHPFHVYKPPFLPLWVRYAGTGPRELPCVVVAQMIQHCGRDQLESEITFEIKTLKDDTWCWCPVSFRQASPPFFHEGVGVIDEGHAWHDDDLEAGIGVIARSWDEILVARGYMEIESIL